MKITSIDTKRASITLEFTSARSGPGTVSAQARVFHRELVDMRLRAREPRSPNSAFEEDFNKLLAAIKVVEENTD